MINNYTAKQNTNAQQNEAIGILLVNLGTPEAPTTPALRSYLKQFLSDPRVVEANRPLWWLVLNLIILNTRPAKSAHAYQSVWTEQGSPLLQIGLSLSEKLQQTLSMQMDKQLHVELAMTYGSPSVADAMGRLREKNCEKIVVLPLYPQYSGSTTAAVSDAVFDVLKTWRRVPDLRLISAYHRDTLYIEALANSVREHWQQHGRGEKLVISFHGIPKRYFDNGDPYPLHCAETAELLAKALGLDEQQWQMTFQSVFGREEWIKPYTSEQLKTLAAEGVRRVDVICPGFAADCLETLEEIRVENRGYFIEAGGEELSYIPALNDREDHVLAIARLLGNECCNWL